jgi:diacylglycerol kinase (ATP)
MESPYKGKTGLRRVWNALTYSLDGLAAAFRHEDAFRQEVLLALVLVPMALCTPAAGPGKALMVAAVLLVLVVELLNSGIEAVTDRISLEDHVLAKRAKGHGQRRGHDFARQRAGGVAPGSARLARSRTRQGSWVRGQAGLDRQRLTLYA